VIGAATLSTPIGQTSLGNYIFTGLQTQNWVFVLFGCAAAAAFALAIDQLLALMEVGLTRRRRGFVIAGGLGLALLTAGALIPTLSQARPTYAIGAKPFAEQYVLAALIEQRLREAGLTAATRDGLGSAVIFNALRSGEIDAYVDYSGTIWTNQMHRTDVKPRAEVLAEMSQWLAREHGIKMLGGLGFENAYALAMPKARAEALGIRTLADLAGRAKNLSIAGDYEFFGRPEWAAVKKAYGIEFREQRQMQPEFMYAAVAGGEVDVIAGYTSDGRIAKLSLMVLDDPKHAIPPYDAVLLISPQRSNDEALLATLQPLIGTIDVTAMREANLRASGDNSASPRAAAQWLWSQIQQKK
jgi:osmoprotectant transport system permease protein